MIIPKERPYMDGLNSYYLDTVKFIEHLQGEIGNGCVYLKSSVREILIYFDEMDIINGVVEETGQHAQVAPSLRPIFEFLQERNYLVKVFQFDPNAIFFWAQLPAFERAQSDLATSDISLSELIEDIAHKKISGFIDIRFTDRPGSCILFFHQGSYVGASYSWGAGGLNPSKDELQKLLEIAEDIEAVFTVGHFKNGDSGKPKVPAEQQLSQAPAKPQEPVKPREPVNVEDQVFVSNLPIILEEFLNLYSATVKKKVRVPPVPLLEQRIVLRADDFPFLDPFNLPFVFENNTFTFTASDKAFGEKTAGAIIECAWDVVKENRLEKKFRAVLSKWPYRTMLEDRGYTVLR